MSENVTYGSLEIAWTEQDGDFDVSMKGQIDHASQLLSFGETMRNRVTIDLGGVSFVNSGGVREWMMMIRALNERQLQLRLERCSEAIVHQMNMSMGVAQDAEIISFFAPYYCEECSFDVSALLVVAEHKQMLREQKVPPQSCPKCQAALTFNDLPARYLVFLEGLSE